MTRLMGMRVIVDPRAPADSIRLTEKPDPCTEHARWLGCVCRLGPVDSASINPPEPVVNEWCPVHGRDPDDELQRRRDERGEP